MRSLWWMAGPLRDGEPGEGGGGGAFDPLKFRTEILAEFNKGLNGALKNLKKELTPATPPAGDGDGDGDGGDPPTDPKSAKDDPKIKALEKQLSKLNETLANSEKARSETEKAASEKERLSLIRSELAKHGLAEHAQDDAFRFFRDEIKRNEEGELVGPDDVPLAEFVKAAVEKRTHWLPPRQVNGTGATGGSGTRGAKAPDLSDIKPGMSKEQKAAIYARIAELTSGRSN